MAVRMHTDRASYCTLDVGCTVFPDVLKIETGTYYKILGRMH